MGSNPTQGMDVWCVYVFVLCLCYPVFRQRPCDELITRSRSPAVYKNNHETEKEARTHGGCRASEKNVCKYNIELRNSV
jgi:hypothetical protein